MKQHNIICLTFFLIAQFTSNILYATEIVVTNANDYGAGSLRMSIYKAADGDIISFDQAYTIFLDSTIHLGSKSISINGLVDGERVHLNGNYLDTNNDNIDDDGVFCRVFTVTGTSGKQITISSVYIENGSTSVSGSTTDFAEMFGGGMYVDMTNGGMLSVDSCVVQNNRIIVSADDPVVSKYQSVKVSGGGIYSRYGGEFNDCIIRNNEISIVESQANQTVNTSIVIQGGGVYAATQCKLTNSIVAGNILRHETAATTGVWGGGLVLLEDSKLLNSLVVGNAIQDGGYALGGGVFAKHSEILNCNIINNSCSLLHANSTGGGVFAHCASIQNSIISENIASGNINISGNGSLCDSLIQYIAISDSVDYMAAGSNNLGWVVLADNPFRIPASSGADAVWGTADDDYGDLRLQDYSPCINGGNPDQSIFTTLTLDFYQHTRVLDNIIDIGLSEYNPDEDNDGYKNIEDNCWSTYNSGQEDYDDDGVGDVCDDDADNDDVLNDADRFPLDSLEWADCDNDNTGDNADPFPCDSRDPFYLKGSVFMNTMKCTNGIVYVYDVESPSVPADSCILFSDGSYEFPALLPETYHILAIPNNEITQFAATYFGDETNQDKSIALSLYDNTYDVDIHLYELATTINSPIAFTDASVYPIPAQEYLYITKTENIQSVTISDNCGNTKIVCENPGNKIYIGNLIPGFYIIQIDYVNNVVFQKFIKE